MKIALLGYGKEGKSVEQYFKKHHQDLETAVFEDFTPEEIQHKDLTDFDYVFRSPSVPPLHRANETSITKYFFDHCPCPIVGVTATKGKGTICSFIKSLLDAHHEDAHLVGNIGTPALDVLDDLKPSSVVVYELSSFQLWDLDKSPHIAVLGHLEPDHLNVHKDYEDYLAAKSNITTHQTNQDYLVFNQNNTEAAKIAVSSQATKIAYPFNNYDEIKKTIQSSITLPGRHNQENAMAAIAAVACFYNISPDEYLRGQTSTILAGLSSFHGLPHRLEFLRDLGGIKIYDDNFATNLSSTRVAINAFPDSNLTIIVGGRDKTNYEDLPELYELLKSPQVKNIILIGESGHKLAQKYPDNRFTLVSSLEDAVHQAIDKAHQSATTDRSNIVLMSPAAASFDMFENVYDRGAQFKTLINSLQ
ncbi:UDP-N-acetylmuramoyl-L-alanine--D-glutamate ligase [Candidatus Saccharibacteria bacterium]|nr:UDP-N-acetylmuramoyl-L-alanine--D-glutamate ligase [Candidatus Saccharibacteria bacterium]